MTMLTENKFINQLGDKNRKLEDKLKAVKKLEGTTSRYEQMGRSSAIYR